MPFPPPVIIVTFSSSRFIVYQVIFNYSKLVKIIVPNMSRAIFFIKIARSYLFTSASASFCPRFCFLLLSPRASLCPCPRFLLFPPLLPSILVPSQICFSTSQIHQSPFFFPRLFPAATHRFRHETVYRGQFSCHLSMFRAATHLFPHKSLYREQVWDGL